MLVKKLCFVILIMLLIHPAFTEDVFPGIEKDAIGISFLSINGSNRQKEFDLFDKIAAQMNFRVIKFNAQNDSALQIKQIELLIKAKVKCIICSSHDPSLNEVLLKAQNNNIKIIRYDSYYDYLPVDLIISIDYSEVGRLQGQWVSDNLEQGNILILSGSPTDPVAKMLHDSAYEIIKDKIDSGKYKILGDYPVNGWNETLVAEILDAVPELVSADLILAPNDYISGAVQKYLAKKNITKKILLTGMDGILESCKAVKTGKQSMTIIKDWNDRVIAAVSAAKKLANTSSAKTFLAPLGSYVYPGQTQVPIFYVDSVVITQKNITELISRDWYTAKELGIKPE